MTSTNSTDKNILVQLINPSTITSPIPPQTTLHNTHAAILLANYKLLELGVKACSSKTQNLFFYFSIPKISQIPSPGYFSTEKSLQDKLFGGRMQLTNFYNEVWDLCLMQNKRNVKCTILLEEEGFGFKKVEEVIKENEVGMIVNAGRKFDGFCFGNGDLENVEVIAKEKEVGEIVGVQSFTLFDYYLDNVDLISHDYVVLGGTFDHFHFGHRKLLTVSLCVTRKTLVVGVTSDKMVSDAKKFGADKMEDYETRKNYVLEFCKMVKPSVKCEIHEINDIFGPSSVNKDLTAIVVSSEKLISAKFINDERLKNGLNTLSTIVVLRTAGYTLSSGFIRGLDSQKL